jgi:hypothetical protein
MDFSPIVLGVFVIASMSGFAIMLIAYRKSALNKQALKDLALAKGWDFFEDDTASKYATQLALSDPADSWQLVIYSSSSPESTSVKCWTEWRTEHGKLKKGIAILGPPLPAKTIKMLNQGIGGPFANIIKRLMFQFTKGMDINLDECRLMPSVHDAQLGAVLASHDNHEAVTVFKNNPKLSDFRQGKNELEQAVVYRDMKGMRVRLRTAIKNSNELERLIALGKSLRKDLSKELSEAPL